MRNIRAYGPGKFDTILDAYVYVVTLDGGCDDELGDSSFGGWYGMMRNGRSIFRDHDPLLETLNDDEQDKLTSCAGVIVFEDNLGFVTVRYYDTDEDLDRAWAEICELHDDDINDDDDDASDIDTSSEED